MPSRVGSLPSTMFSATVITGISMKCWCTIPIPASIASFAECERDRLAVEQDLARVGLVEPVEDVHQRRLAGAVLAEQRVHLARRRSKSTWSLATMPGNALVMPRISRTGASATAGPILTAEADEGRAEARPSVAAAVRRV